MDLSSMRINYTSKGILNDHIKPSPFDMFRDWFDVACSVDIIEPNAMVLSTVDEFGAPHSRAVLLKKWSADGFLFFTNYRSAKANHIEKNNNGSLLFLWLDLERQIRIQGKLYKISPDVSLEYFQSRPLGSQFGAWASPFQSAPLESRDVLEGEYNILLNKYKDNQVLPLPSFWGGYILRPSSFEFWQGRSNRLHDRLFYSKELTEDNWNFTRLYP